jgi:hypothetical protein
MNKFNNNSSTKVKNKIKNKLEKKEKNIRNVKIKNKCNYTDILDIKNSQINTNTHEKKENSKNKRINTSLNKKYNYNKLGNIGNINNYNKDYICFRTIGNEKEINNNSKIKGHIYYPSGKCINVEKRKDKIKKYIYSKEKRKEKSLAEKRQNVKKPISYLAKNNLINQHDKNKNIKNNKIISIKNINNTEFNNKDFCKNKNKISKLNIYKRNDNGIFNFNSNSNYNYNNRTNKNKIYIFDNEINIKKSNKDTFDLKYFNNKKKI